MGGRIQAPKALCCNTHLFTMARLVGKDRPSPPQPGRALGSAPAPLSIAASCAPGEQASAPKARRPGVGQPRFNKPPHARPLRRKCHLVSPAGGRREFRPGRYVYSVHSPAGRCNGTLTVVGCPIVCNSQAVQLPQAGGDCSGAVLPASSLYNFWGFEVLIQPPLPEMFPPGEIAMAPSERLLTACGRGSRL